MGELVQFRNLSSWRKNDITISPHEVYTLNVRDTNPNIFIVTNPNMATLKIGISSIPREESYEFKVEYNTTEVLGRPMGTSYLYILNDSSIPVKITVFSIEKEFEAGILKNMNVSLDGYTIESSSEISGIKEGVYLPIKLDQTALTLFNSQTDILNDLLENQSTFLTKVESILLNQQTTINRLTSIIERLEPVYNHYTNNQGGI